MTPSDPARVRHAGPNPGAVASVFTVLFLAGLVPVTLIAGDTHFPSPLQSPEEIMAYFRVNAGQSRDLRLLPVRRGDSAGHLHRDHDEPPALSRRPCRRRGHRALWRAGRLVHDVVSALVQWVLARPGIATDGTLAQGLYYLIFATGGPGYSVPLGLLIAGISIPALVLRLLPRWVGVMGIVLAVIGELSALSLHRAAARSS